MSSEIDANFFRLIHDLVSAPRDDAPREKRESERSPFDSLQRVAPWSGGAYPAPSEYLTVRCHDLTQRGFSFLLPQQPEFATLIVAFGNPPEIFVAAEVRHVDPVLMHCSGRVERIDGGAAHDGAAGPGAEDPVPMFLVGCRFTRRLDKLRAGG